MISKTENECVTGVIAPARDINPIPPINMYFELSFVENNPAISTPMMKPSADNVKDEPAIANETCVFSASSSNDAPGKTLIIPAQM